MAPRTGCGSGPAHVLRAELRDGIAAELPEYSVDFAAQNAERALHARLAPSGQAVQRGAADHDRLRTERECLDDVRTAAEAAVDENGEAVADRAHDLRQHIDRCETGVELPPAVITQHDAVATQCRGTFGVRHVQHPFDEEPAAPQLPDPGDVIPADGRIEQRWNHRAAAERGGGGWGQEGLEVAEARHALAAENLEEPARVPQYVERGAEGGFAGRAIAALIPFTVAEYIGVGCEHQRLVTRRRGALHDVARVGGVPENRGALMARGGVDEGSGDQPQTLQGFAVGAQRHLVFGPALDVLEREARHAAPGNLAQIGDVE